MSDLIACIWDGRAFVPSTPFHHRRAAERFGEGELIVMHAEHERSARSHRHFFAALAELWDTLPERYAAEQWAQSTEHLRKYALIKTGWSDSVTLTCKSAAEAQRIAAFMRPIDEFSIVLAKGATVVRYTAKSQSVKAMGAKDFQQSKDDVISFVDALVREWRAA